MSKYLKWQEQTITDFSDENINDLYNQGFVFTRPGKGVMNQTRSLRIDLSKFELSSENRRILKKTEDLRFKIEDLPYEDYTWEIGKLAKDFYTEKFGDGTFSANKVREIMTDPEFKNFNKLFIYSIEKEMVGYCVVRETDKILHYSYPFYIPNSNLPAGKAGFQIQNIGMGMMLKAIEWAKNNGKDYIYLGSVQRPTDTYKLQFKGLEWFDGEKWSDNLKTLKSAI